MSQRFHITLSDRQFVYLSRASERTSLSIAELIRRAVEDKYHPSGDGRRSYSEFTLAVWRRPLDEGPGRRGGVRLEL
ncbi:MAG TPA: ribbon-helix-helix domain-containing protein [Gaiellaceae bacterium]|nr:ribbon-helix-helix domain-containing protein [Gaiellaceae bacterium]